MEFQGIRGVQIFQGVKLHVEIRGPGMIRDFSYSLLVVSREQWNNIS